MRQRLICLWRGHSLDDSIERDLRRGWIVCFARCLRCDREVAAWSVRHWNWLLRRLV